MHIRYVSPPNHMLKRGQYFSSGAGIHKYIAMVENTAIEVTVDSSIFNPHTDKRDDVRLLHQYVSAEVFVCTEGEYTLHTEDCDILLRSGDVAIVPPGLLHLKSCYKPKSYVFSFICFPKPSVGYSDLYGLLNPFLRSDHILTYRNQPAMIEKVKDNVENSFDSYPFYTIFKLVEFLLLALATENEKHCPKDNPSHSKDGYVDIQLMMQLDNIIGEYYNKQCSIEEISAIKIIPATSRYTNA